MSSERARRLVTLGSSIAVLVRGPDRPTVRTTYTDVAADALCAGGGASWEPRNHGRWFDRVTDGLGRWERDVAPLTPDVVVLNYGFVDCQTPAVPHRLHRAIIDWKPPPVPTSLTGTVRRGAERALGRWTPRLDRVVGARAHKVPPDRYAECLATLVRASRRELGAHVVVLGVSEPGAWLDQLMPSIAERAARYDHVNRIVADEQGASFVDVRSPDLVPVDGIHLDATGHRRLGQLVADACSDARVRA